MEESIINIRVGNKLFELRKDKSLNQIDVANYIGISASAYSRIERGECSATVRELIMLSELFEVSITWILGICEDSTMTAKESLELEKYKNYLKFKRTNK